MPGELLVRLFSGLLRWKLSTSACATKIAPFEGVCKSPGFYINRHRNGLFRSCTLLRNCGLLLLSFQSSGAQCPLLPLQPACSAAACCSRGSSLGFLSLLSRRSWEQGLSLPGRNMFVLVEEKLDELKNNLKWKD